MKEVLPVPEGSARITTCEEFPDPVDGVNDFILALVARETRLIVARINRLSRESRGHPRIFLESLLKPEE